ncbi:hypothetical protein BJV74DRAFT_832930 [Russula compacta]|nr:hypothetical protein BJV74DRAFT_832930 [Russula compacta]
MPDLLGALGEGMGQADVSRGERTWDRKRSGGLGERAELMIPYKRMMRDTRSYGDAGIWLSQSNLGSPTFVCPLAVHALYAVPSHSVTSLAPPRCSASLPSPRAPSLAFPFNPFQTPSIDPRSYSSCPHMKPWLLRCRIPHTFNNISRLFCAIQSSSHVRGNFVATQYPSTSTVFIRDILTCSLSCVHNVPLLI